MGGIIAVVVLLVAVIGFSAWWKGRLIGQGKIIQRASDFVEYAEIFTIRPIPNEEYAAAVKAFKENRYFAGGKYKSRQIYRYIFQCEYSLCGTD